MDHHGMAYVGDDWQNFDWTKAAEREYLTVKTIQKTNQSTATDTRAKEFH